MKFCQHCGKELLDEAVVCPGCGCSVQTENKVQKKDEVDDSVSAGMVILSILMPIIGIIYWIAKAKTRPRCAKACGGLALAAWIVYFVIIMVSMQI